MEQSLPRGSLGPHRVIYNVVGPPLNLAASSCKRILDETGCISEFVYVFGDRAGLKDRELEEFISGFEGDLACQTSSEPAGNASVT